MRVADARLVFGGWNRRQDRRSRLGPKPLRRIEADRNRATSGLSTRALLQHVEWTSRRIAKFFDNVGVDHCRLDAGVAEVLLDLPDVHAIQQEMRRETMSQRIHTLPMNRAPRLFTIVTIRSTANP
jgi:hypothetical protein